MCTLISLTNAADICEDEKQLMYTRCSYVYPSGNQCTNPIPRHLHPPLCGGHCDNVNPPKVGQTVDNDASKAEDLGSTTGTQQGSTYTSDSKSDVTRTDRDPNV